MWFKASIHIHGRKSAPRNDAARSARDKQEKPVNPQASAEILKFQKLPFEIIAQFRFFT
jgi:hypothetical protein